MRPKIMIGKELLHFSIEAQLGAGGMGEVYQARDTKLGRNVAVKILPEMFARDAERIARFEREAKLLASLNHANIAALYGLEQADGKHFLVMELVEGDTLAQRISRGALPVEEALKIAHQITEALEAAHDKGVIHRDLKPANVKITPEGKVKVLDFGLAKALDATPAAIDAMNSPTLSVLATNAGMILGTAGYMSPEQAKGRSADQRSDIFSFGCVLYEMLTGRLTFEGETITEVLASVLKQEADLSLLPQNIHSRVVELIKRCLVKDPKRRWHSVADVRVEIETILAESRGLKTTEAVVIERQALWKRLVPIALAAIVVGAITGGVVWTLRPQPDSIVSRFTFIIPDGQPLTRAGRPAVAISPDGKNIVYQANRQLYLRPISDVDSRPIEGTNEDAANPFFSPDGLWIGFYSNTDSKLKKISITGGAAVTIAETDFMNGASWTEDNQILYASPQRGKGILRVSANGGTPETIIAAKPDEATHGPQLLPDGEHVLFSVTNATGGTGADRWDKGQIVVESLKSHERKVLVQGSDGRYLPTGQIMYALGTTVFAVPFDAAKLNVTGGPVPILEDVARAANASGAAHISFANNGSMVYLLSTAVGTQDKKLALVDRSGKSKELALPTGGYAEPRISPDGRQISILNFDEPGNASVWIYDLSGSTAIRKLTFDSVDYPLWTRDSQRIIFKSGTGGNSIFWQRADGNGAAEQLEKSQGDPNSVSPDGQTLIFRAPGEGGADIWMLPLTGERTAKPLISATGGQDQASFSPDGRWIVYRSNESGQPEIYVQPYPPVAGVKYQLTTTGGNSPLWSPDGKQIFYTPPNAGQSVALIAVDVRTQPTFAFANATKLPITNIAGRGGGGNLRPYDITPDGKQFLIVTSASEASDQPNQRQLRITLNWFEELKQRVPVP